MSERVRVIISIVISSVLLAMVVIYLIRAWMPTEVIDWVVFVAASLIGIYAIHRIANLAKALESCDKRDE